MEEETKTILDALSELLEPLGKKRKELILGWVAREVQTHAIVQYVYEEGPPMTRVRDESGHDVELGGPQVWRIGEPSPLVPEETVFAMFHTEQGAVTAYSFKPVEVDGRAAVYFFRSLICKPIHVHGPVHHDALTAELGGFLADDDELEEQLAETNPEPAHASNGA